MGRTARRFAGAVALAATFGCGPTTPSQSVTGSWSFTFGKFRIYQLSLTQSGDRISGVACAYSIGSRTVRETAVTGDYPDIRFADPMIPSCVIEAKYERERDQIAGDCGDRSLVRFNRSETGRCEAAAANPFP